MRYWLASFCLALAPSYAGSAETAPTLAKPTRAVAEQQLTGKLLDALAAGRSTASVIDIWTDPDGRAYDCKLVSVIGDKDLANQSCGLFLNKRFDPAQDSAGAKAFGRLRTIYRMAALSGQQAQSVANSKLGADLELSVNRLPGGYTALNVKLILEISSAGTIKNCLGEPGSDVQLAAIACKSVAEVKFPQGYNRSGAAVPYVTNAQVRFVTSGT